MQTPMNPPKSRLIPLLLALLVISILVGAGLALTQDQNRAAVAAANAGTVHVTNIFADINGDGKPDLIRSADVILNVPQQAQAPLPQQ